MKWLAAWYHAESSRIPSIQESFPSPDDMTSRIDPKFDIEFMISAAERDIDGGELCSRLVH